MGDIVQTSCLKFLCPDTTGPILEIGSRIELNRYDEEYSLSHKDLYPNNEYIGLDLLPGKNVDIVLDLTEGIGDLEEEYFDFIICCSVLEHVKYPWKFAVNVTRLLKPGGAIFLSVPWVWKAHSYPNDYYRYSPAGVEAIFEDLKWDNFYGTLRERDANKFIRIRDWEGFDISWGHALGLDYNTGMKPMMINAIGYKEEEE